uniref:Xrn1 N-terminal domain-containing protein n=1 Tax=viral metagenome TaxID=1070528 RepID=A0A6C0K024_9ZZZZ
MGIPSYFSYIIKNHAHILNTLHYQKNVARTPFSKLYMDCNSIIYDAFHNLEKQEVYQKMDSAEIERFIISDVIASIKKYIHCINPSSNIYIAFDGVAPFAKMEQQRTRRYKSQYLSELPFISSKSRWNTASITPGTNFMNTLSEQIAREFEHKEAAYGVKQIIVSGSNVPGEGEHKMYEHLRANCNKQENVAIYGLDSDLIMLSIFHTVYCYNIYIFREAIVFGDSNRLKQHSPSDSKLPLFLNVHKLMKSICKEMDCGSFYDKYRVFDYVFLCFFLGNDFLPHFPALNIRTHGIQVLLDTYRQVVAKPGQYLITMAGDQIVWKNVNILVKELAKNEHNLLLQEYDLRDKWDKRQWPETTPKEKEELINNAPVIFRAEEKYISPNDAHWETRYYNSLFHKPETDDHVEYVKAVSINYLEGLEWVFKYYTKGCPDWKWKYNYHYPPLCADLIKYVPHFATEFICKNTNAPFSPYVQLSYVLPPAQMHLLPEKIRNHLFTMYPGLSAKMEFQWAFCRYFWEAHNKNAPFGLKEMEQLQKELPRLCYI